MRPRSATHFSPPRNVWQTFAAAHATPLAPLGCSAGFDSVSRPVHDRVHLSDVPESEAFEDLLGCGCNFTTCPGRIDVANLFVMIRPMFSSYRPCCTTQLVGGTEGQATDHLCVMLTQSSGS